jgi:hypothetical protein
MAPDYSQDPFYINYIADRKAAELAAEVPVPVTVASNGPGTSDGAGWFFRELPSGDIEWRPEGKPWAPNGWEYAIDPHDRFATGGPQFTIAEHRRSGAVPKLRKIVSEPTHPTRRPDVHYSSSDPGGVRYGGGS